MDFKLINVGIADSAVSSRPDVLRTVLGSCVGICLYDAASGVGGLSHIMLPVMRSDTSSKKKYADTAIPLLIAEMEEAGADIKNISAKIAGGASMFKLSENSMMAEIGPNNIKKAKEVLAGFGIELSGEDTGGDSGRTIDFYLESGIVKIKSLGKNEREI